MKNKKLLVTAIAAAMVLSMQATTVFAGEVSDSDLSVATASYAQSSGEREGADAVGEASAEKETADSTLSDETQEPDVETFEIADNETDSPADETDESQTDDAADQTDEIRTNEETDEETSDELTEETGSDAYIPSVTEATPSAEITDDTTGTDSAEEIVTPSDEDDDDWEDWEDWENNDNADDDIDWDIEPVDPQEINDAIASLQNSLDEIKQSQTLTPEETEQIESAFQFWIEKLEELKKTEPTGQDVMDFFASVFTELFKQATADMEKSGQCGDNLQWELDVDSGKLTVSGKGDMYDYDDPYALFDTEEEDSEEEEDDGAWVDEWLSDADEEENEDVDEDEDEDNGESSGFAVIDFSKFLQFGSDTDNTDDTEQSLSVAPWLPMYPLISDVTLQDGVTSIGNNAFPGCVLKTLTLPSSVTRIGSKAFDECDIDDVYYAGSKEEWAQIGQGTANAEAFANAEMHYLGSQQEDEPVEEPPVKETEKEMENTPDEANPSDGANAADTENKSVPNAIDSPATGENIPLLPLLTLMASVFSMALAFLSGKLHTRSREEC